MLITSPILKRRGVCGGMRAKFRRKFPKHGVRVTARMCERYAQAWPWEAAAEKLLNEAGRLEYRRCHLIIIELRDGYHGGAGGFRNGISYRAMKVAEASIFGRLAEQRIYDPAYTP